MTSLPITYPDPVTERFTLTGSGSLVLTEQQRQGYALSIVIEKIRLGNPAQYYNFRVPEPQSFWGYLQLVNRDFVQQTQQLEYRRQEVISYQNPLFVQLHELRCLIGAKRTYHRRYYEAILEALDGIAETPPSPIDLTQAETDMSSALDTAPVISTLSTTAIWYEIAPGFGAQITLTSIGWPAICRPPEENQPAPPAPAPGAGESGGNASGGGGNRNAPPPPIGRRSDQLSDSPAPPPDTPSGPDVPIQAPDTRYYVYRMGSGYVSGYDFSTSPPTCLFAPTCVAFAEPPVGQYQGLDENPASCGTRQLWSYNGAIFVFVGAGSLDFVERRDLPPNSPPVVVVPC